MSEKHTYKLCCGIDISATTVSVAIGGSAIAEVYFDEIAQNKSGYHSLDRRLQAYKIALTDTLLVMEATGTYWMSFARYFSHRGYHMSVVNPSIAHGYARSLLVYDKTDALDARVLLDIACYKQHDLRLWHPPPVIYEDIYQRLRERDQLVSMRTRLLNRQHSRQQRVVYVDSVEKRKDDLQSLIDAQIQEIDTELITLYKSDHSWSDSARYLLSIPGIGSVTAGWILVATQNFETFETPQQAAAFAGLVPRLYISGTSVKKRAKIGKGGHPRLRRALFIAAWNAARYNPHLKAFYNRLLAKKKPKN
ncbi:MAG: IS110 family transposase, partial [Chloroflexota bacterium]